MGFLSNLAPLLNYLRRRSPGSPFQPDPRQAEEREEIVQKRKVENLLTRPNVQEWYIPVVGCRGRTR